MTGELGEQRKLAELHKPYHWDGCISCFLAGLCLAIVFSLGVSCRESQEAHSREALANMLCSITKESPHHAAP